MRTPAQYAVPRRRSRPRPRSHSSRNLWPARRRTPRSVLTKPPPSINWVLKAPRLIQEHEARTSIFNLHNHVFASCSCIQPRRFRDPVDAGWRLRRPDLGVRLRAGHKFLELWLRGRGRDRQHGARSCAGVRIRRAGRAPDERGHDAIIAAASHRRHAARSRARRLPAARSAPGRRHHHLDRPESRRDLSAERFLARLATSTRSHAPRFARRSRSASAWRACARSSRPRSARSPRCSWSATGSADTTRSWPRCNSRCSSPRCCSGSAS